MLLEYFTQNFMTLAILMAIIVMLFINNREKIPGTDYYSIGVSLMLVLTGMNFADSLLSDIKPDGSDLSNIVTLRLIASTTGYILRPFIIMTEVLVVVPDRKYLVPCVLPAVSNMVIYSTAFTHSDIAFTITENNQFHRGPLGYTIFITQILYLMILFGFSALYFKRDNYKQALMIFLIFVQSITVTLLEISVLPGYANEVTALCMLEYYTYLSLVHQNGLRRSVMQKDLDITRSQLLILKNQMQPHFMYNSLSIIRSLVKHNNKQAISCIDDFSKYLKSHISAIQNEELIPFEQELENARIYLSLAQVDYSNKIEICCEMEVTDFMLPPLSLEPIIENAVEHGISREGGRITIRTSEADGIIKISVSNDISEKPKEYKPVHNGIALDNTRRRLEMLCEGSLVLSISK